MYLLRKRTVEVCSSDLTTGPQEPRRPRFPFFHLHNVKEQTLGPLARAASSEAGLPEIWEQERASGCPAEPLPYPETPHAAAAGPRRSALAGYMVGPLGCQQQKMTKPTKTDRTHFPLPAAQNSLLAAPAEMGNVAR